MSLGPGVWSFAETHLSSVTQESCAQQLRSIAAELSSSTPSADPGFWRLKMTVRSCARMLRKEPRRFSLWQAFVHGFQSNLFSGPFCQLIKLGC